MADARRIVIEGRAVPVSGDDIDTDRIMPARYLRTVVFEGLGEHVFEDDRAQLRAQGQAHPLEDERFAEASIMLVDKNFGCGSSREHAAQAIQRWGRGIRAIVGQSFAEIFSGNCVANGVPCSTVSEADMRRLRAAVEADPTLLVKVDLAAKRVTAGNLSVVLEIPEGPRQQFLEGRWDATKELLANREAIEKTASRLPYVGGY